MLAHGTPDTLGQMADYLGSRHRRPPHARRRSSRSSSTATPKSASPKPPVRIPPPLTRWTLLQAHLLEAALEAHAPSPASASTPACAIGTPSSPIPSPKCAANGITRHQGHLPRPAELPHLSRPLPPCPARSRHRPRSQPQPRSRIRRRLGRQPISHRSRPSPTACGPPGPKPPPVAGRRAARPLYRPLRPLPNDSRSGNNRARPPRSPRPRRRHPELRLHRRSRPLSLSSANAPPTMIADRLRRRRHARHRLVLRLSKPGRRRCSHGSVPSVEDTLKALADRGLYLRRSPARRLSLRPCRNPLRHRHRLQTRPLSNSA